MTRYVEKLPENKRIGNAQKKSNERKKYLLLLKSKQKEMQPYLTIASDQMIN